MRFESRLAPSLRDFLGYKRDLGFAYSRGEHTLRSFDRYVAAHAPSRGRIPIDDLLRGWLARTPGRKPQTIAADLAPIREFLRYRRRFDPTGFVPDRGWIPSPPAKQFLPHVFSVEEIRMLVERAQESRGSRLRKETCRLLTIILYCTGLRVGEAARLRIGDVDLPGLVFLIRESKGKTRYVPFGQDLGRQLRTYVRTYRRDAEGIAPFLVRADGRDYTTKQASYLLRSLLRRVGLKARRGRIGPRAIDFRHTFAVHRLTRWYEEGVDLQSRLPWLSAYMGHDNILGTETYLTATPELLAAAADRFASTYERRGR